MTRPRVSVIVDTYNHAAYIEQAIESVLEQELPAGEMEVIVVDDGSSDDTAARVARFAGRVRYLRKTNGGQASAFNASIPEARGEIVAFCDGDDWWAPGKLREVMRVFDERAEVGTVGHGFYRVREGEPLTVVAPEREYTLEMSTREGAARFAQLKGFLGASKVAVRRRLLERILPIPEELVIEADEYLFTLAVAQAPAVVLPQPLFYYRIHENNLFQFEAQDEARARRKQRVLECLLGTLPGALARMGVSAEAAATALEPLHLEAAYTRLALEGGWPWEMYRTERALGRHGYRGGTGGYGAFRRAAEALALVLPPRTYHRLKQWYARRGLAEWRARLGSPVKAAPVVQHEAGATASEQGKA